MSKTPPLKQPITQAITQALTYLLTAQNKDGSWTMHSYPPPPSTQPSQTINGLYLTTYIIHTLTLAKNTTLAPQQKTNQALHQASQFILSHQSEDSTWNYEGKQGHRVPNDLDDTACCIAALAQTGHDINQLSMTFYPLLWNNAAQPGGPYYTWLGVNHPTTTHPLAHQLDSPVNANIQFASTHLQGPIPNITHHLTTQIQTGHYYNSPYALSPHFPLYLISRLSTLPGLEPAIPTLQNKIQTLLPQSATPFQQACLITAWLNLTIDKNVIKPLSIINYPLSIILATQNPNGSFPTAPAWRGFHGWLDGGSALTTAVILEGLIKLL